MPCCWGGLDTDSDDGETLLLLHPTNRRARGWRKATAKFWRQRLRWSLTPLLVLTISLLLWFRPDVGIHFKYRWSDRDYPPLIHETESTRVLHIEPGSSDQRIRCQLETVTFEEKPTYSALSYTWGGANIPMKSITVNGKRRRVSEHLWNALQSIRDPRERLTIWVDAICINQQDEVEKSRQVGLMSFTYSRADEVLVWLGHQQPPRWVENSRPTQWKGSWAVDLADEYWGSALFWVYRLVHQEYWKRVWPIQELGMAKSVKVYFGRQAIPWSELIKLVKLYSSRVDDPAAHRVLEFERLRQSRYSGGTAYTLFNLLNVFRDSFSTVALDKVYAFVSMATHFGDAAISADYTRSIFEIYQDVTMSRNLSTVANEEKQIDAIYFSGLVRQLLAREPGSKKKKLKYFGALYDPATYLYDGCGDGRAFICLDDANITAGLAIMDTATWFKNWLVSWIFRHHHEDEAIWRPSLPESPTLWLPRAGSVASENIRVRAITIGEIRRTGPSYSEFLSHPPVAEEWATTVENLFVGENDIRRARAQVERLEALLSKSGDLTPQHVMSYNDEESTSTTPPSPVLFLGTDFTMGLVPSGARPGNVICQFWNSSASVLLRRDSPSSEWTIFGRSAVIIFNASREDGGESGDPRIEWDRPEDKARFFSHDGVDSDRVEMGLTLSQLTRITFDTVVFPSRKLSEPDEDQYPLDWSI